MPIVNLLSAPYLTTRSGRSSSAGTGRDLAVITRTPEQIHNLLKSSLPTISNDIVEISEVARRRAQGHVSWIPTSNNYKQLLASREKLVHHSDLRGLKEKSMSIRRRVWKQTINGRELIKGGPEFQYTVGSDHRLYTVDGSISIDSSPIPGDAIATRRKARMVRNTYLTSLAPPTSDYRAAQSAINMGITAGIEIRGPVSTKNVSPSINSVGVPSPTSERTIEATQVSANYRSESIRQYQQIASTTGQQTTPQDIAQF